MKNREDVLVNITKLYDKAISANDLDLASRILDLAARLV